MTALGPPEWCRWRHGRSGVLVVGPHGGRRDPISPARFGSRQRKVNDLHTADLAEELAAALDGALIINPAVDRNHLDLNRISQVASRAPWFLSLIESLLEDILARHQRAEVLFVHGWNVMQSKCDIGVGRALPNAAGAEALAGSLTVSPAYAAEHLGLLQTRCAAAGIAVAFGERYPARHPNNLLQVFRRGSVCSAAPERLAAWAAAQRIEAVQLELGVPLRWPGPQRREFVAAAVQAFGSGSHGAERRGAAPDVDRDRPPAAPPTDARPASLQLYDPIADVGLTARVDVAAPHVAGRLLLFLGQRRLALFIGEDADGACRVGGPHFTVTADGFRLHFAGTALSTDDGLLYVDLEQAFAASALCAVDVDLHFRTGSSSDYGVATGRVEVDGEVRRIDTHAFARHGVLPRGSGAWSSQVVLSAAFGPQRALRLRHEFPGPLCTIHELSDRGPSTSVRAPVTICFDGDRHTPARIAVGDGAPLVCEPQGRMAITRPLTPHRLARVTFGPARFECDGAEGFGFYEYARVLE